MCKGVQVYKLVSMCINVQISTCTSEQISMCASVQVYKLLSTCTNVQISMCTSEQISKCTSVKVYKLVNVQGSHVYKCPKCTN